MDFDTKEIKKMEIKERKHKEKPKKSKVATAIIILLTLMNLSLLSYIAYDKKILEKVQNILIKEEKYTKKVKEEQTEKLSLTSEEVNTLYSYLTPLKEKLVMTDAKNAKDLTDEEQLALSLMLLKEEDFKTTEDTKSNEYDLKRVLLEEASMKILGHKVTHQDMKNPYYIKLSKNLEGKVTMDYDSLAEKYKVTFTKEEKRENYLTKLVNATKKGKDIILEEKVIYILKEEENTQIYSNWRMSSLIEESKTESIQIDDYLKDASTVYYTFRKENDSYQFQSSKIKEKN